MYRTVISSGDRIGRPDGLPEKIGLKTAIISRQIFNIRITQDTGHWTHHRIFSATVTEGLHLLDQINPLLTRQVRPHRIATFTGGSVATSTTSGFSLAGRCIAGKYSSTDASIKHLL